MGCLMVSGIGVLVVPGCGEDDAFLGSEGNGGMAGTQELAGDGSGASAGSGRNAAGGSPSAGSTGRNVTSDRPGGAGGGGTPADGSGGGRAPDGHTPSQAGAGGIETSVFSTIGEPRIETVVKGAQIARSRANDLANDCLLRRP